MFDRIRLSLGVGAWSAVTAVAFGLLFLTTVPAAQAAPTPCPAAIIACGCTINQAAIKAAGTNTFVVQNDIFDTDGLNADGNCIDIKAKDVVLDGDFDNMTGSGSGVGVRIFQGAVRATVQNFGPGDCSGEEITGWDIGIEDDANAANINNDCLDTNGTAGVFLKGANKSVVDDFDADDETTGSGIILNNSNQNVFQDFDASNNAVDGLTVTNSNRNSFTLDDNDLDDNGNNGATFTNSGRNSLSNFFSDDNIAGDGVAFIRSGKNAVSFFTSDDNANNGVSFTKGSNNNSLSGFDADDNIAGDGVFIDPSSNDKVDDGTTDHNGSIGVEIAQGSKGNSVIFMTAIDNLGSDDLLDNNANCANGKNVWQNDCFFFSSPSECIPLGLSCI